MLFYLRQNQTDQEQYRKFLTIVGSLSNLFSDSNVPYLYYRIAEKIFCRVFSAEDLSRNDTSADAKKDSLGIGLKTFLAGNNRTFQKIAEFNIGTTLDKICSSQELITRVSETRNARIDFAKKAHDFESSIYHCVLREPGKFKIFEEPMDEINIQKIGNIRPRQNAIHFDDGIHEYSFLRSKSTLTKRFLTDNVVFEFDVELRADPLLELQKFVMHAKTSPSSILQARQTIFLPLYGRNRTVYTKSGLNQWNASGRARNPDEVYIPIPVMIHQKFPMFFPKRHTRFSLIFPDGERVTAKVCQENGKALMTYSNRKLGKLILRDGLKLKEDELATYDKLQLLGIDSVRIDRMSTFEFKINFAKSGSYEEFINNNTVT